MRKAVKINTFIAWHNYNNACDTISEDFHNGSKYIWHN